MDPRLGRRWNIDPVVKPWLSGYSILSNNPIIMIDPDGDDDFVTGSNGSIERKKTNSKSHSYYSQNDKGDRTLLGTYKIVNKDKDLIKLSGSGKGWVKKDKNEKNYLAGDVAATFLSTAYAFNKETGSNLYVTQFSTSEGGHSGHAGDGDYIDLKYVNKSGGYGNSSDADYSQGMSQQVVDLFRNYGYRYDTRQNKSKYDIITGTSGGKTALTGTNYVKGHVNHIHVGNYGFTHVKMVNSFSVSERSNTPMSTAPRERGGGSFIGWLKSLDAWLEGNSSGPDGH